MHSGAEFESTIQLDERQADTIQNTGHCRSTQKNPNNCYQVQQLSERSDEIVRRELITAAYLMHITFCLEKQVFLRFRVKCFITKNFVNKSLAKHDDRFVR